VRAEAGPAAVPTGDLRRERQELGAELDAALARVLERGWFILGPEVEAFEQEFAAYSGSRFAIGVASGTDAIMLALSALQLQADAEVITTTLTSVATVTAIIRAGLDPVLVDIDPATFNLDARLVEQRISPRTGAILPVHLYGRPADMGALVGLAQAHGLPVIEDACQAHGALIGKKRSGTVGRAGCFSFYPSKNLGAYGDGGMVISDDPALAERVRLLRQYGWRERDRSEIVGFNSRLDELQAAVLRLKLERLDAWNSRRRAIAQRYRTLLGDNAKVTLPADAAGHAFHLYVVRVRARDRVRARLRDEGIATGVHYPLPIHQQPALRDRFAGQRFPEGERACQEILSLPIFPQLSDAEVDRVAETLDEVLREAR
jgi:dTDP-4-amino-4,6-dideoxygalactose transaminase